MSYLKHTLLLILLFFYSLLILPAQVVFTNSFQIIDNFDCKIQLTETSGNALNALFRTLPANQGGNFVNTLFLWENSEVPWRYPPIQSHTLDTGIYETGSYVFNNIQVTINTPYIACYAVGKNSTDVVACSMLKPSSNESKETNFKLEIISINNNALSFHYSTLPGYLPLSYNNWFGIWEGEASPYNLDSFKPIAQGKPLDDASSNNAILENLELKINQAYTLIYFLGENNNKAGAIVRFFVLP